MNSKTTFFAKVRQLIAANKLSAALQQLSTLLKNSTDLDEIIQQSARFHDIRKQIRLGVVSHEDANLTQNQIRAGLIDLVREIEEQSETPTIHKEIEKAISIINSKNVVVGDINAAGNISIGDTTTNTTQNAEKIYNIEKIDKADFS